MLQLSHHVEHEVSSAAIAMAYTGCNRMFSTCESPSNRSPHNAQTRQHLAFCSFQSYLENLRGCYICYYTLLPLCSEPWSLLARPMSFWPEEGASNRIVIRLPHLTKCHVVAMTVTTGSNINVILYYFFYPFGEAAIPPIDDARPAQRLCKWRCYGAAYLIDEMSRLVEKTFQPSDEYSVFEIKSTLTDHPKLTPNSFSWRTRSLRLSGMLGTQAVLS